LLEHIEVQMATSAATLLLRAQLESECEPISLSSVCR
jgi:hypothetical protein